MFVSFDSMITICCAYAIFIVSSYCFSSSPRPYYYSSSCHFVRFITVLIDWPAIIDSKVTSYS